MEEETTTPEETTSDRGDSVETAESIIKEDSLSVSNESNSGEPAKKSDSVDTNLSNKTDSERPQSEDPVPCETGVEAQPEISSELQKQEHEASPATEQENVESQTQEQPEKSEIDKGKTPQAAHDKIYSASASAVDNKRFERVGSAASNRHSDIFHAQNEEDYLNSSLFSVNGAQSRRVFRQREAAPNNIFPRQQQVSAAAAAAAAAAAGAACESSPMGTPRDKMRDKSSYHEVKRPSSSIRNPLTGTGMISNDEFKVKANRRKDGNPLLGVGYPETSPATQRTPPGGFCHKLW